MTPKKKPAVQPPALGPEWDILQFCTSQLPEDNKLLVSIFMFSLNQSLALYAKMLEERGEKTAALSDKVTNLEQKITAIETRYDEQEAEERKNDIAISCEAVLEYTSGENIKKT